MSDGEKPALPLAPAGAGEKQKAETLAEVIRDKAPDILDSIPAEQRAALARISIEKHEFSMRSSPLPDPAELAAYNQIIPAGADRILKMAEAQSAHRIEIETIVVKSQQTQGFCGQLFALVIGISALGMATYAAISGQPWFGSVIGGTTLVSLVSAFLYSRFAGKRELDEKRKQLQNIPPIDDGRENKNQQRKKKNNRRK